MSWGVHGSIVSATPAAQPREISGSKSKKPIGLPQKGMAGVA